METRPIRAVFFDVRDTLGDVDSPGHLVPYRPSTQKLLEAVKLLGMRIGAITNLPADVSDDAGRDMVVKAVLSQNEQTGQLLTIGDFITREDVVTNKEAGTDKPDVRIYHYAAKKFRLDPSE